MKSSTRFIYHVLYQIKHNSFFLLGLFVGFYIALVLVPLEDNPGCIATPSDIRETVAKSQSKATTDGYEPEMNPNVKQISKSQYKNIQRPRYYSTELGIRDKLFVGILSSEENINKQATAINKTIAHLTNKIKFFITANVVKSNLNLTNVVGFTDTREMLKPFHVLKYIADNFLGEFNYFFIISDVGFVNGRKLLDVVNKISISEDVYMGTIAEGDSHYCSLDTGILLSSSVLSNVQNSLDWCVRNSYSPQHYENIGRCILHSTALKCTESIQITVTKSDSLSFRSKHKDKKTFGQKLGSIRLGEDWQPSPALADVVSVYPVTTPEQTYKLHAYVSRLYLERVSKEILSLRSFLVSNVRRHPPGYRNSSWPGGLRSDAGMAPPLPATRFDHLRWTNFNESHAFLPDDHHAVTPLTGATKKSIELVLEAAWSYGRANWADLEPAGLVEGQWQWDPPRALNYLLLLRLTRRDTNTHTLKRLQVCKPLGQTHILPVPYVTESARISMLLPVLPERPVESTSYVKDTLAFLDRFKNVCLKKGDKTFLLLVFLYKADTSNHGPEDPYNQLKQEALSLSEQFKDSGGKVEWLSVRLPAGAETADVGVLRSIGLELGLSRVSRDTLVLWSVPDMEFAEDFLNRVRMNTIIGRQIFSPIPFARFSQYLHPKFVDSDGNKPQVNTGRFDDRRREILSLYRRDYEAGRTLAPVQLPLMTNELDIPNFLEKAKQVDAIDLPLKILMRLPDIHVLRAPEPGLILKPKGNPPCLNSNQECLKKLESHHFDTLNLGARSQLAKLIFESEDDMKAL